MNFFDPIFSILIAIGLIAVREGLVIKDMNDNISSPLLSAWWHRIGFVIRFFLILSVFLILKKDFGLRSFQLWLIVSISILLASAWYNIAINLINKQKWYYLSNKGIDGFIKKLFRL
jgi:hypothetical protein